MVINKPYLLFLGDASDQLAAKTAEGVAYWRRNDCVGQTGILIAGSGVCIDAVRTGVARLVDRLAV